MPFHDLNVPYTTNSVDLSQTLLFLSELGYSTIAVSLQVAGKIPPNPPTITLPTVNSLKPLNLLTRLTVTVSDPSQNHRLASLQQHYNLLALRPTTEKAFGLCCTSLECDLISIDFSQRLPFLLKFKTISAALQRGIRLEICYSAGITGGSDARRNLISGATALIRATRGGRGIIISSEAKTALACRGPWDVINLAVVWSLGQERGKETVCEEADKVVRLATLKRTSFRGVVEVIQGDAGTGLEKRSADDTLKAVEKEVVVPNGVKRKASSIMTDAQATADDVGEKQLSKRELKRSGKKAKLGSKGGPSPADARPKNEKGLPMKHEAIAKQNG